MANIAVLAVTSFTAGCRAQPSTGTVLRVGTIDTPSETPQVETNDARDGELVRQMLTAGENAERERREWREELRARARRLTQELRFDEAIPQARLALLLDPADEEMDRLLWFLEEAVAEMTPGDVKTRRLQESLSEALR
ncbi:MAG: hypothetical protein HYY18_20545 [Planctomycetes bacterium]|nr:hypothetical protein [Planctomycetota bacterium]